MKKSDYWQFVRTQRAHGPSPIILNGGVISINNEGLASYAHDYWKQNGIMPDDYMPIPGKEQASNYFRALWRIARDEQTFIPVVLDTYETHYLLYLRSIAISDEWFQLRHYEETGPFRSTVEALQIRKILQKALQGSKGISFEGKEKETLSGLMYWCLEYCELKYLAANAETEGSLKAFFKNADILSLISENVLTAKEIEAVLETFEEMREKVGIRNRSPLDADKKSFNEDIRPILVGKLVKEAKTFGAWQKVFTFSQDRETKIFVLYHMSEKAKSLTQVVEFYRSAASIDMVSLAHSFMGLWRDMCSKMTPEDLLKMSSDLELDHKFIEDLILQKCED